MESTSMPKVTPSLQNSGAQAHQPGFSVVSIGDLVADLVVTIPHLPVEANAHQLARHIRLEPGGAGNFLIAGRRLGMHMLALDTIGDDVFGAAVVEILSREGVDVAPVMRQPGTSSTTVIVLVDEAGEHVFLGGYGVGPSVEMPEGWVKLLRSADAAFASGYTFQEKRLADAAMQALQIAYQAGVPVFFDPGPEMAEADPEQVAAILATSNALLLTEEEVPLMTGGTPGISAARQLLDLGPGLVCVKRGAKGCLVLTPDQVFEHPGFQVPTRDTTAAGDSFAAAFIYAYLRGWPLSQTAAFANAMGAAKVQKIGSGSQVPSAEELRLLLRDFQVELDF
jgi:sugar/nucleoside kinase (ribokinase family)